MCFIKMSVQCYNLSCASVGDSMVHAGIFFSCVIVIHPGMTEGPGGNSKIISKVFFFCVYKKTKKNTGCLMHVGVSWFCTETRPVSNCDGASSLLRCCSRTGGTTGAGDIEGRLNPALHSSGRAEFISVRISLPVNQGTAY